MNKSMLTTKIFSVVFKDNAHFPGLSTNVATTVLPDTVTNCGSLVGLNTTELDWMTSVLDSGVSVMSALTGSLFGFTYRKTTRYKLGLWMSTSTITSS